MPGRADRRRIGADGGSPGPAHAAPADSAGSSPEGPPRRPGSRVSFGAGSAECASTESVRRLTPNSSQASSRHTTPSVPARQGRASGSKRMSLAHLSPSAGSRFDRGGGGVAPEERRSEIMAQLEHARADGRTMQLRVQLPAVVLGTSVALLPIALIALGGRAAAPAFALGGAMPFSLGLALLLVAVMPTDRRVTQALGGLLAAVLAAGAALAAHRAHLLRVALLRALDNAVVGPSGGGAGGAARAEAGGAEWARCEMALLGVPAPCAFGCAALGQTAALAASAALLVLLIVLRLARGEQERPFLVALWRDVGRWLACAGVLHLGVLAVALGAHYARASPPDDAAAAAASLGALGASGLWLLLLGGTVSRPGVRERLHSWLSAHGPEVSAAAGVAALIGSRDEKLILAQSVQRFRAISLEHLEFRHLESNAPDPSLHALSTPAELGAVDAFISHSWSDDVNDKWAVLQRWRERFRDKHGREARVWLDRACIDQSAIEDNLLCLPVFLAGCSRVLAIAGESYSSRLWCVIELFCFIAMGGSAEAIELLQLRGFGAVEGFDVRGARCHKPEDAERLLLIVESTHGGLDGFNAQVRAVLDQAAHASMLRELQEERLRTPPMSPMRALRTSWAGRSSAGRSSVGGGGGFRSSQRWSSDEHGGLGGRAAQHRLGSDSSPASVGRHSSPGTTALHSGAAAAAAARTGARSESDAAASAQWRTSTLSSAASDLADEEADDDEPLFGALGIEMGGLEPLPPFDVSEVAEEPGAAGGARGGGAGGGSADARPLADEPSGGGGGGGGGGRQPPPAASSGAGTKSPTPLALLEMPSSESLGDSAEPDLEAAQPAPSLRTAAAHSAAASFARGGGGGGGGGARPARAAEGAGGGAAPFGGRAGARGAAVAATWRAGARAITRALEVTVALRAHAATRASAASDDDGGGDDDGGEAGGGGACAAGEMSPWRRASITPGARAEFAPPQPPPPPPPAEQHRTRRVGAESPPPASSPVCSPETQTRQPLLRARAATSALSRAPGAARAAGAGAGAGASPPGAGRAPAAAAAAAAGGGAESAGSAIPRIGRSRSTTQSFARPGLVRRSPTAGVVGCDGGGGCGSPKPAAAPAPSPAPLSAELARLAEHAQIYARPERQRHSSGRQSGARVSQTLSSTLSLARTEGSPPPTLARSRSSGDEGRRSSGGKAEREAGQSGHGGGGASVTPLHTPAAASPLRTPSAAPEALGAALPAAHRPAPVQQVAATAHVA